MGSHPGLRNRPRTGEKPVHQPCPGLDTLVQGCRPSLGNTRGQVRGQGRTNPGPQRCGNPSRSPSRYRTHVGLFCDLPTLLPALLPPSGCQPYTCCRPSCKEQGVKGRPPLLPHPVGSDGFIHSLQILAQLFPHPFKGHRLPCICGSLHNI